MPLLLPNLIAHDAFVHKAALALLAGHPELVETGLVEAGVARVVRGLDGVLVCLKGVLVCQKGVPAALRSALTTVLNSLKEG